MKNELIIAQYRDLPRRRPAERLQEVLRTLGLEEMGERFFAPWPPEPAPAGKRTGTFLLDRNDRVRLHLPPSLPITSDWNTAIAAQQHRQSGRTPWRDWPQGDRATGLGKGRPHAGKCR
jgi:hypothetical protein